jgi:nickel-dependent lactate racemase
MKLTYGDGVICELSHDRVIHIRANPVNTLTGSDVTSAVREALAQPMDYPNLASATVPGDTVAIALQYATPELPYVLEGVLAALEHAGVERSAIMVVLASEFVGDEAAQKTIRKLVGDDVAVLLHDASVEEQLALLGITEANRTLRLNRVLCDADLVIPVGPFHPQSQEIEFESILFPSFSDDETRSRFHAPVPHETLKGHQKLAAEARECDWMLGVGLSLQIVPGPEGNVAAVLCGTPSATFEAAQAVYDDTWKAQVIERANLVLATIVGNETQQTWHNLSRALIAAEEILAPGGAIAICSEIATRPGPSGKRLRDAADLGELEQKLTKDEYPDSLAALQLCRSLQRGTVYLKSQLDSQVVERLGLAPISSDQELERLVQTYQRCVVLDEAQYLIPSLMIETSRRASSSAQ